MNKNKTEKTITLPCPDCKEPVSFLTIRGWYINPIICKHCHALIDIEDDCGEEWELIVIDRV